MKIIKEENNENYFLKTQEIEIDKLPNLNSTTTKNIINLLAEKSAYPKQIAKILNIHEQNAYYCIKKLEKANLVEIEKQENINGTIANFYKLTSDSYYFKTKEFKKSAKIKEKESDYLKPFIENGKLNALIIVGSPDPHGPQKARSKDGYYGMDLALFLGTYLSEINSSKVKLDTQINENDLKNNLIIIGGPIVNKVCEKINEHMPIYFDQEKKGIYSKITKKTYFNDEIGIVNKIENPFHENKMALIIGGIRNSGTKASIVAFLKNFEKLKNGNEYNNKIQCRVVEGLDLDSDSIVDDCEFLE